MNSSLNAHMTRAFQTRTARGVSATHGLSERRRHPQWLLEPSGAREVRSRHWKSRSVRTRARGSRCCRRPRRPRRWWRAPDGRRALRARRRGITTSSRVVGARGAVWRVARGASSPARGRASVAARASAARRLEATLEARQAPVCCAPSTSGRSPATRPPAGDDAKASAGSDDAEAQFKTGLGSDPAFDAALASVSDMASDAAPRDPAEEKPRELTKEDFVALRRRERRGSVVRETRTHPLTTRRRP